MKMLYKDIYLRLLNIEDINERYISWFKDDFVTEFLESRNFTIDESKDYLKKGQLNGAYYIFAICLTENDFHIGNVKIGPFKRKYGLSDLVTVIGDREYWGKNIASLAIKKAIKIGFKCAKIRKFSASIDSLNKGSIKAYIKGGFIKEGVIPKYFLNTKNSQVILSDKIFVGLNNKDYDIDYFATWTPVNKTSNFWKDFTINER